MDQESRDLKKYIAYLRDIKKYSPHTVKAYAIDIRQFQAFFAAQRLELTKGNIRAFIAQVFAQSRNKATVARKIYAVRSFYGFLVKSGALAHNPLEGISSPKQERKIPRILTENEMQEFLDALPEENFLQLRNKAMFEFLYATGLRISELTGLRAGDIHFPERLVRVLGKGKKERIVPFHEQAAAVMGRYLQRLRLEFPAAQDLVFINSRGGSLTPRSVERILKAVYHGLVRSQHACPPPPAAPFLRHPPAAARGEPARHPGAAGPFQPGHDREIHHPEPFRPAANV